MCVLPARTGQRWKVNPTGSMSPSTNKAERKLPIPLHSTTAMLPALQTIKALSFSIIKSERSKTDIVVQLLDATLKPDFTYPSLNDGKTVTKHLQATHRETLICRFRTITNSLSGVNPCWASRSAWTSTEVPNG